MFPPEAGGAQTAPRARHEANREHRTAAARRGSCVPKFGRVVPARPFEVRRSAQPGEWGGVIIDRRTATATPRNAPPPWSAAAAAETTTGLDAPRKGGGPGAAASGQKRPALRCQMNRNAPDCTPECAKYTPEWI
jgi:hypothetical protein